jgi:hypothetical protein
MSAERRRHVRVKPTSDLPVRVALGVESLVRETAEVHDVSASGLALGSKQLASNPIGTRVLLELMLGTYGDHRVHVEIRWTRGEAVGVELVDPAPEAAQSIRKYVAELLERGQGG